MDDERKENDAGVPPPPPSSPPDPDDDSLELTPLLLLLRSAIGDVPLDSSEGLPAADEISDKGGVRGAPKFRSPTELPAPPTSPPGNQLGKLVFSVSIRS